MDDAAVERAAKMLAMCRIGNRAIGALPADCRPTNEADAYRIQAALHAHLTAAGRGPIAGHKIGCTTEVMQKFLSIHQPAAGGVFASTVFDSTGSFPAADHRRLGVECEIAVRLAADLPADRAPYDRDRAAAAVGRVMAAIELVDDRYADYATLGAATLIADDFFNAGAVLGVGTADRQSLDLAAAGGRMAINGQAVGEGRGADVMGHPLNALAWLADRRSEQGRPLKAGEFVLLGSVVETKWVAAGDEIAVEIDGLGTARAAIV